MRFKREYERLAAYPLLTQRLKLIRLRLLLLILLNLARDPSPLRKIECRILRRLLLFRLRLLVLPRKLQAPTDLLNQSREVFWRLGGDGFDIALEDEEVFGFDEDVV